MFLHLKSNSDYIKPNYNICLLNLDTATLVEVKWSQTDVNCMCCSALEVVRFHVDTIKYSVTLLILTPTDR